MTLPAAAILCRLPAIYAVALTLRDVGLDDVAIAERLEVPVESMTALFELAELKVGGFAAPGG